MSDKRYEYKVKKSNEVVRYYTIECEEELHDDVYNDIRELISQVDCTKEGDSAECRVNGVKCVVTYDDSDYGDDGQVSYSVYVYEDVLEDGVWSSVATIYPERSDI